MTRLFLTTLGLLGASACLVAFQGNVFRYTDGNMTLHAGGGRAVQAASGAYTFYLSGNVDMTSIKDAVHLTADQITSETEIDKKGASQLKHAVATGHVHATKIVTNGAGKQTTDIVGSRADLKAQAAGSIVTVSGPVTIVNLNEKSKKTMTASGSSAIATLEPGTKTSFSSGLRNATLSGPVRVRIVQSQIQGRGASTVVATGNRMDITYAGKEPMIVLTGNVEVHGEGDSRMGHLSGRQLKIWLNKAGEVSRSEVEA